MKPCFKATRRRPSRRPAHTPSAPRRRRSCSRRRTSRHYRSAARPPARRRRTVRGRRSASCGGPRRAPSCEIVSRYGTRRSCFEHLDAIAPLHALDGDVEVRLAHAGEQHLRALRVARDVQRRIFFDHASERRAQLIEVALRLRRDGGGEDRRRGMWMGGSGSVSFAPSVSPVCVLLSLTTAPMSPAGTSAALLRSCRALQKIWPSRSSVLVLRCRRGCRT